MTCFAQARVFRTLIFRPGVFATAAFLAVIQPHAHAQLPSRELWKAPNNKTYVVATVADGKMYLFIEEGVGPVVMHPASGANQIMTQGALTQAQADELVSAYISHLGNAAAVAAPAPSARPGNSAPATVSAPPSPITSFAVDGKGDLVVQTNQGPQTFRHDGKRIDITYIDIVNRKHVARLEYKGAGSRALTALATAVLTDGTQGKFTGASWVVVSYDGEKDLAVALKKGTEVGDFSNRADQKIIVPELNHKALLQQALDSAKSDPAASTVAQKFGTLDF